MRIYLKGETPSKKNSRINLANGRSFPSKRYLEWHKSATVQVYEQTKPKMIDYPCRIEIEFIHGDKKRRDSDNMVSSVLDLLVDTGVLADDNWLVVREINVGNSFESKNPCCFVSIESVREAE